MTEKRRIWFEDGVLKADCAGTVLAYDRPADLAAARLRVLPPIDKLELGDGKDALQAAFETVPFVADPLPKPFYGGGLTAPAQDAFTLFLGQNVDEESDDFVVIRGEPGEFLVCARRYHDVWKVGAFTVEPMTLTVRFEDLWAKLPPPGRYRDYLVEVERDPNAKDTQEQQGNHIVRETLSGIAPDVRICLDLDAGGGFVLSFWPVAG